MILIICSHDMCIDILICNIPLKISIKSKVVINEESNVLKEERTNSETLPVNHIPSYVGLSCAVSGYRSINKLFIDNSPFCIPKVNLQIRCPII
ncbi:hypothetical protein Avbf_13750 [Armadillidium vulgare]|nr:hypothetical protein Avbf_13750 [Armadillidium vulgare]